MTHNYLVQVQYVNGKKVVIGNEGVDVFLKNKITSSQRKDLENEILQQVILLRPEVKGVHMLSFSKYEG